MAMARRLGLAARVLVTERVGTAAGQGRDSMWQAVAVSSASSGRPRPTGRRVWATDRTTAPRLARRRLPGAPDVTPGVRVRGEVLADSDLLVALLRNTPLLTAAWTTLLLMALGAQMVFCTQWAPGRLWRGTGIPVQPLAIGDTSALSHFAGALGTRGVMPDGVAEGIVELAHTLGLLALWAPVPLGLHFLFHSSGWRSVVPWLVPFVAPITIGLLPGASGLVIREYLDGTFSNCGYGTWLGLGEAARRKNACAAVSLHTDHPEALAQLAFSWQWLTGQLFPAPFAERKNPGMFFFQQWPFRLSSRSLGTVPRKAVRNMGSVYGYVQFVRTIRSTDKSAHS